MTVQTSQLSVGKICYKISSNVTKHSHLSLSLYPKIISGMASRKRHTFATNPFSCQVPIGSNVATGCSCSTAREMWQFGRYIFQLQCGYFRTVLMYQNTGEWVDSLMAVWLHERELMKRNKECIGNKKIFIIKLIQVLLLLCAQAEFTIISAWKQTDMF